MSLTGKYVNIHTGKVVEVIATEVTDGKVFVVLSDRSRHNAWDFSMVYTYIREDADEEIDKNGADQYS